MAYTDQNDRSTSAGYDADGRVLNNSDATYSYDAAGRMLTVGMDSTTTQTYDGDGQRVKTIESVFNEQTWAYETTTKLYVRSSVLGGQVISEMDEQGNKLNTYVYAGTGVLARQFKGVAPYSNDSVSFEHRDPSNASLRTTYTDGQVLTQEEYDPLGADANLGPTLTNVPPVDEGGSSLLDYGEGGLPSFLRTTYILDGMAVSADFALQAIQSGAAYQCPNNDCGPRAVVDGRGRASGFVIPQADALGNFTLRGSVWVRETSQSNVSGIDENGNLIPLARGAEVTTGGHWRQVSWSLNTFNFTQQPETERELTLKQRKRVDVLKELALKYLKNNQACKDYLRGNSTDDPSEVLRNMNSFTYFNGIQFAADESEAVAAVRGDWTKRGDTTKPAHIVLGYSFFYDDTVGGETDKWGVEPESAQIETILHELRHYLIKEGHKGGESSAWDKKIYDLCLGGANPPTIIR